MNTLMPLAQALEHAELVRRQLPMSLAEHALLTLHAALDAEEEAKGRREQLWEQRITDLQAEFNKQISVLERRLANTPAPPSADYCGKGICAALEGHEGACST